MALLYCENLECINARLGQRVKMLGGWHEPPYPSTDTCRHCGGSLGEDRVCVDTVLDKIMATLDSHGVRVNAEPNDWTEGEQQHALIRFVRLLEEVNEYAKQK